VHKGVVIKSTGRWYLVKEESGKILECGIKGRFRTDGLRTTNPVAVGDNVTFEVVDKNKGIIIAIDDKKNYIIRKSTNLSKAYHIIASNIDQAIIIAGIAYPETPLEFVDRFLVSAEAYRIPVIIVFNKIDLFNDEQKLKLKEITDVYKKIGYDCVKSSATTLINIDIIKEKIQKKRTVVVGQSGVGKSALLNACDSNLNIKTSSISEHHLQGKHTTTFAEMHQLSFGGEIIDTPGIRGFGVVDMEKEEISHFFPEIFNKGKKCKFYNCSHIQEPGCKVIEAAENGDIYYQRYLSYISMVTEDNERYR
jgi:ribosome biogenesis GTPase